MDTLLEDMLYISIIKEDQCSVLQYLAQGADPNKVTCHGRTCLGEASRLGKRIIVKMLIDACKSTPVQNKSHTYSKKKHCNLQIRRIRGVCHEDEALIKCKNFNDKTLKGGSSKEYMPPSLESRESEHNQGYFIFKHGESSSSDESKKITKSHVSPTVAISNSQAELEWDEEVVNVAPTTREDEIWSSLYKWYADILENTGSAIASSIKVTYGIDQPDAFTWTALHYAAEKGHTGIVKLILDAGGKVDVVSSNGHTPLHFAAKEDQTDVVLQLLAAGGNVNYQTHEKMTPLHFAAVKGSEELIRILLRHGANYEARDASDCTPLYYAAGRGNLDIVKFLIDIGSNVNGGNIHGYTPLCQAVWHRHPKVVEILLLFGARVAHSHGLLYYAIYHNQEEIATLLANKSVSINLHNDKGDTPLTLSAKLSRPAIARMLLEKGADPNSYNNITWGNALHTAVDYINGPKEFEDILLLLMDYNINLNSTALTGDTALSRALVRSNDCAAALLIRHGADVNACELRPKGLYNLELAVRKRTINLVKLLIKAGHRIPAHDPHANTPSPNTALHWLYLIRQEPLSLFDICRIRIRNCHGNMPMHRYIDALYLPKILKRCLMLEDEDYFCSK